MSNESNNNLNINHDNSNFEKASVIQKKSVSKQIIEETERNGHFNLRQRKKINYSVTRPDFYYESLSDSEYEEYNKKLYIKY